MMTWNGLDEPRVPKGKNDRLTRDEEKGKADCDQVFTGSHDKIFQVKLADQASPNFIPEKRSEYSANSP